LSFAVSQMVTFTKNPYSWVDDQEVNSAVLKLDMSYKDKPVPARNLRNGLGVTVPYNNELIPAASSEKNGSSSTVRRSVSDESSSRSLSTDSFTNATLSSKNNYTAVISIERVSAASVLQLYVYIGKVTAEDLQHFDDFSKVSRKSPFIYAGYVNITLFHGNSSDALDALERSEFHLFAPVWLYDFRFVVVDHRPDLSSCSR